MILDCLIVKGYWLDLILEGKKPLEIRGCRTSKRGLIGLIESGSGEIKGLANISGCDELTKEQFESKRELHRIENAAYEDIPYKKVYGWSMKNAVRLNKPIQYRHPKGAVIWVKAEVGSEYISEVAEMQDMLAHAKEMAREIMRSGEALQKNHTIN